MNELVEQLPGFVRNNGFAQIATGSGDPNDSEYETPHMFVDNIAEADVINSQEKDTEIHRPVIDIDLPMAIIPSTTPGHGHLYIDKPMSWYKYERLLYALESAGIIEEGYLGASLARGYTSVRLPWVKKQAKEEEE